MPEMIDVVQSRDEKFRQDRAQERALYDRAVLLAKGARTAPAVQRRTLWAEIAEVREALLKLDDAIFNRPFGVRSDLEFQAASLSIGAITRDAILAQLDQAERTMVAAERADEAKETLKLVRATLSVGRVTMWISWAILLAAVAALVATLWDLAHRERPIAVPPAVERPQAAPAKPSPGSQRPGG